MTKAGEQTTITQSLRPCPFCGKIPELRWHSSPECWVECECGAVGPNDADTTTDENMAAWNTRASLAAQDGLVEAAKALLAALGFAEFDVLDGHNLPFPKPTVEVAAKKLNAALSAIKGDKS